MTSRLFTDPKLVPLYDLFCDWDLRDDFDFYLPFIMDAESVLDIGCGTGMLLHVARDHGHTGRLCGVDPADEMSVVARQRSDIEWITGDMTTAQFTEPFELVVMTGHAFQNFLDDDETLRTLTAIRSVLAPEGRFAFETRNPLVREWEMWTPDNVATLTDEGGNQVSMSREVTTHEGDIVKEVLTYTSSAWTEPEQSEVILRFPDNEKVLELLTAAGFTLAEQYGDWNHAPFDGHSPEIITFAR